MTGIDGRYTLGSDHGRMIVRTTRTGLGRRAGHDLTIEATSWRGEASVDTTTPARSEASVTVDVASLIVREGAGGVKPLSDDDRAEIAATLRSERLLRADTYPTIAFASTRVDGEAKAFVVEGDLTILGRTHPISLDCAFVGESRVRGGTMVAQSRWGVTPYSAFLGALKVADEVEVEFETALVPLG